MLPLVAGKGEIPFTGEAPLFLPHGVVAERNGINGVQQLRGQKDIQMLRQIAPAHILHLTDVGLQDEILGIGGKLPSAGVLKAKSSSLSMVVEATWRRVSLAA